MKNLSKKKIIIFLLIISVMTFFIIKKVFQEAEQARYVLAQVERGTIVVSESGTGQVKSSDQVEIKSSVSGEIVYLNLKEGQVVQKNQVLVQLDTKEAEEKVKEAELKLKEARLNLTDIEEERRKNLLDAEKELKDNYENILNLLTNTFPKLSSIVKNIEPIYSESSYREIQSDFDYYLYLVKFYNEEYDISFWKQNSEERFLEIEEDFNEIREKYWKLSTYSSSQEIEFVLKQTEIFLNDISQLLRQSISLFQKYLSYTEEKGSSIPPISLNVTNNQFSLLNEYFSLVNNKINSFSSVRINLENQKEKIEDLNKYLNRVDIDIEQEALNLQRLEKNLEDAKKDLNNHYIIAPFSGTITKINSNLKRGDLISNSSNIFTLITEQKIVEISLNEIDVAKIEVGQKANISFDALIDLFITGRVIHIDTVGTTNQGVVSYGVKIALDTDSERIRPSMSATVDIIIEARANVLILPINAVKRQEDLYYVELVQEPISDLLGVSLTKEPKVQTIKTGFSNDFHVEIISGLNQGDVVVSSVMKDNSVSTTGTQQVGIPGIQMNSGTQRMMR